MLRPVRVVTRIEVPAPPTALTTPCKAPLPRTVVVTGDIVELLRDWQTAYADCAAQLGELVNWSKSASVEQIEK